MTGSVQSLERCRASDVEEPLTLDIPDAPRLLTPVKGRRGRRPLKPGSRGEKLPDNTASHALAHQQEKNQNAFVRVRVTLCALDQRFKEPLLLRRAVHTVAPPPLLQQGPDRLAVPKAP